MKIINWNVGRPGKNKIAPIIAELDKLDGDILILTETNTMVIPMGNYYMISTNILPTTHDGVSYNPGEIRTSVWTKFRIKQSYKTFDAYTSVCADIETPLGLLTIYATIIGVFGGRGKRFNEDLHAHFLDFDSLFPRKQVCIVGDYNVIFSGHPYPSHSVRGILTEKLNHLMVTNVTSSIENCVDHISISNDFLTTKRVIINESWNTDKALSDHVGISVTL